MYSTVGEDGIDRSDRQDSVSDCSLHIIGTIFIVLSFLGMLIALVNMPNQSLRTFLAF